jgi:hypothetical protein
MSADMERTLDSVMTLRKRLASTVDRLEAEQKIFQGMLRKPGNKETRRTFVWVAIFAATTIFFSWIASLYVPRGRVIIC